VVWCKGVLQNSHVPELVRVPARERTKWNKITKAVKEHQELHSGALPSVEELAFITGFTVQEVFETQRRRSQAGSVLSLDQAHQLQSRSGAETTKVSSDLVDRSVQDVDADLTERTQLRADLIAAMARNLDTREARLLRLRYGLSDGKARSLQECADSMGLSYARVQQLSKRCLNKLRQAAEAESLEEYLLTIA
jgi:RNA polymerase primary sigma factor